MPRPDRSNIRVHCPQCLATLDVDSSQSGQRVDCPKCSFSLQVPSAGVAGANLFEDLFDDGEKSQPPAKPERTSPTPNAPSVPSSTAKPPSPTAPTSNADPLEASFDFDPESLKPSPTSDLKMEPADPAPMRRSQSPPESKPVRPASPVPTTKKTPRQEPVKPATTPPAPSKPVPSVPQGTNPLADEDIFGLPSTDKSPVNEIDLSLKPIDASKLPKPIDYDPLAADRDAPIEIEGIESARASAAGTIAVRCKVCESSLHAPEKMLGKRVVCPDCGSNVLVIMPPKPKGELPAWARSNDDWREIQRQDDEKRFPLGAKMNQIEDVEEIPPEWGLPDEKVDLMQPLPTLEPQLDEYGEELLGGSNPNRRVDQDSVKGAPFLGGVLAAQEQTKKRLRKSGADLSKKGESKNAPNPNHYDLEEEDLEAGRERSGKKKSGHKKPGGGRLFAERDQTASTRSEPENDDDETASPGEEGWTAGGRYIIKLENLGAFDGSQRRWLKEVVRDRELWIRCAAAVGAIGMAYWMLHIIGGALADEEMSSGDKAMRVAFPGAFGGLCLIGGWLVALMTASLVFQQSGDRRPRFDEWPGFGLGDWGESILFFGVSLWLGSLPGLLMGLPLMFSNMAGLAMVVASLSAFVFSPPLLLAAWYNGSAFQVYSNDVLKQFRGGGTDWLRYLPGSLAGWLLFAVGYGVTWIPVPFTSFIGAALQVAGTILFATTTGLYCGLMARRIERGL